MTPHKRKVAFEEVIRLSTEIAPAAAGPASSPVYPPADPAQYIPKSSDQPLPTAYVPADLYPGGPAPTNDNEGQNPLLMSGESQGE